MEPDQEVAMNLACEAIEWLQGQGDLHLERDAESIGGAVGNLYAEILKRVKLAHKEPEQKKR